MAPESAAVLKKNPRAAIDAANLSCRAHSAHRAASSVAVRATVLPTAASWPASVRASPAACAVRSSTQPSYVAVDTRRAATGGLELERHPTAADAATSCEIFERWERRGDDVFISAVSQIKDHPAGCRGLGPRR